MANPKPADPGEEISPEHQKYADSKQQQIESGTAYRGDRGQYMKSGRQQKEEEKTAKKAARPAGPPSLAS
jgi:hypothetical protein